MSGQWFVDRISHVLIARYQNVETAPFGSVKQFTVLKAGPAQLSGTGYLMTSQRAGQWGGSIGVEQNLHAAAGCSSEAFANRTT